MPKVIQDLELLKKLQPYIKRDTEYFMRYCEYTLEYEIVESQVEKEIRDNHLNYGGRKTDLKTLTTEGAIELLPNGYMLFKTQALYICEDLDKYIEPSFSAEMFPTPIEALEKMLNYLINNNLMEEGTEN